MALRIMISTRGFESYETFCEHDRDGSHLLRKALFTLAVCADIRHWRRFRMFPWVLAILAHPDATPEEKADARRLFFEACDKCLDKGLSRQLRRRILAASELDETFWCDVLKLIWYEILGHTLDVELDHAFNNMANLSSTKFELLASRFINKEARRIMPPAFTALAPLCDGVAVALAPHEPLIDAHRDSASVASEAEVPVIVTPTDTIDINPAQVEAVQVR